MTRWTLSWLFFMVWATTLLGQSYPFIRFTRNEGLAGNTVYTIHQDSKGYLWVGTETGLSRYDGYSFKNYGVETGLPTNEILGNIIEDSKGRIWFGSLSKRPFYYDLNKERFFTEKEDSLLAQVPPGIEPVYEDSKGYIYFAGINKYVVGGYPKCPERWSRFLEAHQKHQTYTQFFIVSVWETEDCLNIQTNISNYRITRNNEYFARSERSNLTFDYFRYYPNNKLKNGHYIHMSKNKVSLHYRGKILSTLNQNRLNLLLEHHVASDSKGNFYQCNSGGLWRLRADAPDNQESITRVFTNVVRVDDEDNIWIGTRGQGLWLLKKQALAIHQYQLKPTIPEKNKVYSIQNDVDLGFMKNKLIIGSDHGLIYSFDRFKLQDSIQTILEGRVLGIFKYKGIHYTYGDGGLTTITNPRLKERYSFCSFRKILVDSSEQYIWGAQLGVIQWMPHKDSLYLLTNERTYALQFQKNYLWFGNNTGLYRLKKQHITYTQLKKTGYYHTISRINLVHPLINYIELVSNQTLDSCHSLRKKFPQLNEEVRCLLADATGGLCIASLDRGITYIRGDKGWHWNEKNGMKSSAIPSVNSLSLDSLGNIWIATAGGVHRLSFVGNEKTPKMEFMFGYTEGLLSNETFCTLRQGDDLYIGTDAGLNKINLKQFSAKCVRPPKMHFTALRVQDQDYRKALKSNFDLPYDSNRIEIEFTGLSLGRKIRYDFLVIKGDRDTIDRGATFDRTYRMTNLAPGDYRFLVRGDSQAGCYSNYITLRWTIHPHWLFSVWGIALQVVTALGLIGFSFLQYQRYLKKKNREKLKSLNKRIQELTLEARLAQIKPHFVSNALNAIRNKVFKQEWDVAHKYIVMFSDLARRILDSSARLEINLAEEVENLELYIGLQQLRFEDEHHNPTFLFQINVAPNIIPQQYILPTMVIQPYVENAIEHGFRYDTFTTTKRMGKLSVDFELKEDALVCTVTDNGVGRKVALQYKQELNQLKVQMGQIPRMSRGMAITEERVASINALFYDQNPHKIEVNIIDLDDNAGNTGTQVVIRFPIERRLG